MKSKLKSKPINPRTSFVVPRATKEVLQLARNLAPACQRGAWLRGGLAQWPERGGRNYEVLGAKEELRRN